MAISSAMYAAVTGLSALGAGMQTISNNIANVNTVGFKAGRTNYEDLISQNYFSGGRVNQRGCGVKVSSVQSMFTQGSFMSSAQDTDMAIAGEGFFSVRNTVTNEVMYTRAGNFTLTKDGLMEDPSGNILQGWQMSIPKPGQDPVRIGAPTDIKIVVLNAPPVETSQLKIVVNLNAGDSPAYTYDEYELAHQYAHSVAEPLAQSARTAASLGYWDPDVDNPATTTTPIPPGSSASIIFPVSKPDYVSFFVKAYNDRYGVALTDANAPNMRVFNDGTTLDQTDRALGRMTLSEFNSLAIIAEQECLAEAERLGNDAYATLYSSVYNSTKDAITSRLPQWQLEGAGFAGVWNAQENPPIDPENYTYTAPIIIYDSLGAEHQMMIYYQKNPYMENVWDYIITSDPLEDARKDANNNLLLSDTASFSGLIQKGKITFAADNDSARHGGMIKDIEAQNLDLSRTKMATTEDPAYPTSATAVMRNAVVDGYYTGQPSINPATGLYESTSRTYDIRWGAPPDPKDPTGGAGAWSSNVKNDPATSGFSWWDEPSQEWKFTEVYDKQQPGPYYFGSGLTLTFDTKDLPLRFGTPGEDGFSVTAHSEQMAWTNIQPNKEGYFDFDVAFVQSASMALHPPYPEGLPTIIQNIALDMGARNPYGLQPEWTLDEQSTTQYATKSSTIFADQDGYAAGSLQRISIGEDGIVTGVYTNGRNQPLYQIGLTRFLNPWGLSKEGDNLFSETRYSGQGAMNEPGYGGTGTILANFLEQSNVDLAEEIVNMIVTQRGFQANSKTITTTDTMLSEVIEMKR